MTYPLTLSIAAGNRGFTVLPAASAPLSVPTQGVIVHTAGNLGLVLADGSNNAANLIAVTAGMFFPLQAIALAVGNTAGVWGTGGVASTFSITGSPATTADKNLAYVAFTPVVTGGLAPYAFASQAGTLPAGITLNASTGILSGTPTANETQAGIVIRVTDANGQVASLAPFTITVANSVTITGTPVTTGNQNVAYTGFTVTGSNGTGAKTYSLAAGTLPTGITLNSSTGAVAGTPTVIETKTGIVIRATDTLGQTADLAPFQIAVSA